MKTKKQTNNYSGPDLNDKFMKSLGFFRDPVYDLKEFNYCGTITHWTNSNLCRVITEKDKKLGDFQKNIETEQWCIDLWWKRNFYPNISMVANDLYAKGLLPAGEYLINIDW